jgi:cytochrome oxidase assembly protein ShyY1
MASERGRFPVGLTLASLIAFAILIGLGVWQVKRLAWKTDMLARIEAIQHAPAPADIPNNHLSYAITWFGLAGALVGVYAALLRKKMQGR